METVLQTVTIALATGGNHDFWKDVSNLHKNIEMPPAFTFEQNGEEFLVSTVKGEGGFSFSSWKYQRITVINLTTKQIVQGPVELTVELDLPVVVPPKKYKQVRTPGVYEVVVAAGGSYYAGGTILKLTGGEEEGRFFSYDCPARGRIALTGEEVIITSSSHEVRGGHGEGNMSVSTLQVTNLNTMKPVGDDVKLLVQGELCERVEVTEEE